MGDPYIVLWVTAAIVFAVIEGVTFNLITVWFSLGAIAALIAAYLGAGFPVQVALFFLVSLLLLILLFPVTRKYLSGKKVATNADRVLEKQGVVIKTVNNTLGTGQVKVGGDIWSARSSDGSVLEEGAPVCVLSIEGVKLIVKQINEGGTN